MPDLLTHALLAYSLATLLSWRYAWITKPYVTAAMAGAFIPDLIKIYLVLPSETVHQLIGLSFSWEPLRTSGGVVISILIGVILVAPQHRRRAFLTLSLGAGSHLLTDALLRTPSGRSYPILWPITRYNPPTPGLYLSTDIAPGIIAAIVAITIWILTRAGTTGGQ